MVFYMRSEDLYVDGDNIHERVKKIQTADDIVDGQPTVGSPLLSQDINHISI